MSDKKYSENDPERTLITLDQLSQTIEVMTSVVNRLRQHLSDQIKARREIDEWERAKEALDAELEDEPTPRPSSPARKPKRRAAVVEVSRPEPEFDDVVDDKTLH
jgi:hypothetical protein